MCGLVGLLPLRFALVRPSKGCIEDDLSRCAHYLSCLDKHPFTLLDAVWVVVLNHLPDVCPAQVEIDGQAVFAGQA